MRILVIDDDRVFSEPLLWALKEEGYEVELCKSVEEVVDEKGKLIVPQPDCILLDIMMPHGDRYSGQETGFGRDTGLRLLEDIQKQEHNVPVIIITVRQDLNKKKLQEKFGKDIKEVLIKPVTPSEIINELETNFPE